MKKIILVSILFLASFVLAEAQSIKLEYKGESIENKLSFSEIRVEKSDEGSYTMRSEIYSPDFFEVIIKVAEIKKGKYLQVDGYSIDDSNGAELTSRDLDSGAPHESFVEITSSENGVVSGNFETKMMSGVGELIVKGTFEKIKLE